MHTLRAILCQKHAVERLSRTVPACGAGNGVCAHFIPHVAAVMRRVEVAAGDAHARFWSVKLTALVHEIPPTALVATLQRAGMADVVPHIVAILTGFDQVWRAQEQEEWRHYVHAHRAYLESLLLFEVAQEGAATAAMRAVARLGGLEERVAEWSARLAGSHSGSPD